MVTMLYLVQGFQWYTTYRDCPENLEDDESSGRPDAIETVRELISTDRRMPRWMIKNEL